MGGSFFFVNSNRAVGECLAWELCPWARFGEGQLMVSGSGQSVA